ncbi:MAG: glycosyltransferase, partial [Bacteroidales bacterium]|nr:glycosyltransferase [Candidatus Cacconaster equi]
LGIDDEVIWMTDFVPDSEVKYYFCAADLIVQPYKSATQSGVTQIAYHFGRPMLVTHVGGLPEIVPDGKVGYVVEPSPDAVTKALERFLNESPDFSEGLKAEKKKYSWKTMADAFITSIPEQEV